VSFTNKRHLDRAPLAAFLVLGVCLSGCQWITQGIDPSSPIEDDRLEEALQTPAAVETAGTDEEPADAETPVVSISESDEAVLANDNWIMAVGRDPDSSDRAWRHPALEDLLSRPPHLQVHLPSALSHKNPVVAGNAAIGLARSGHGDDGVLGRLAGTIRSPNLKLPMRLAAVEALGEVPNSKTLLSVMYGLLYQYADYRGPKKANYNGSLHAGLIRTLDVHFSPTEGTRFVEALRSPSAEVRIEALRAWRTTRSKLPVEAVDLRSDGDYRVRVAALRALASTKHPKAHKYLSAALRDTHLKVRTAAIESLGILGGARSVATLRKMLKDNSDQLKATATTALAAAGDHVALVEAAADKSWRVRERVAQALSAKCDRQTVSLASELLKDPSVRVQHEVIAAVEQWPLEKAGPILLAAMGSSGYMSRKLAAEQLAERWEPAVEFPVDGPPQRRDAILAKLRDAFRSRWGFVDREVLAATGQPGENANEPSPALVDRVEQLVADHEIAALQAVGPMLIGALEQLVFERHKALPEFVYDRVLTRQEDTFRAIDKLRAEEVQQRRRGAAQLMNLAAERPLGRLAISRLAQVAAAESDQLVWQSVLTAVADDGSEPSIMLAYAAISHPMPEVRRRACVHLGTHADPRHAGMLITALGDSSQSVNCAAARALGTCGDRAAVEPLKRLLVDGNEQLRLETALALVRLDDMAGTVALERLSYSRDPKIRHHIAAGLGELGQAKQLPLLIRLLDDDAVGVRRAALESLTKTVGRDMSANADGLPAATEERIQRWKQWYAQSRVAEL